MTPESVIRECCGTFKDRPHADSCVYYGPPTLPTGGPFLLSGPARCPSVYPGSATLKGHPIRCDGSTGHLGRHGHSFAARYWD